MVPEGRWRTTLQRPFLGNWWDYYLRALERIDQKDWSRAEDDLLVAIARRRGEDTLNARTYGVHFIRYYPWRELGVVCYESARYEEAVRHLERSWSTSPSARTAYYLNRARRALLEQTAPENQPPEIALDHVAAPTASNVFGFRVRGTASDVSFVRHLCVGTVNVPLQLARQQVPFDVWVPLPPDDGPCVIILRADDLLGNRAEVPLHIDLDRQGPMLSVEDVQRVFAPTGTAATLNALAYDRNGIVAATLEGRLLPASGRQQVPLREQVALRDGQNTILLELCDRLGNTNHCRIPVPEASAFGRSVPTPYPWRFASVNWEPEWLFATAPEGPEIEFTNIPQGRIVYSERFVVEFRITDKASPIAAVSLNGQPLELLAGQQIQLSRRVALVAGSNEIVVSATNAVGVSATRRVQIEHRGLLQLMDENRLAIAVAQFAYHGEPDFALPIQQGIQRKAALSRRFRTLEVDELAAVMRERGILVSQLADPAFKPPAVPLPGADLIVAGLVETRSSGVSVWLRVIDVRHNEVRWSDDGYAADTTPAGLRQLAEDLYFRLEDQFPIVEGAVAGTVGKDVLVSLGLRERVRPLTALLAYRLLPNETDPLTGEDLGPVALKLGELEVRRADARKSYARPLGNLKTETLVRGDRAAAR